MTLGERLKKIRNDVSQKDFGAKFGATPNTIRRYETGANPPDADFLLSVCNEYSINPTWLLTGEGQMHKGEAQNIIDESSFDLIPMIKAELSAGGGAFVYSEDIKGYYAFRKDWVRRVASGPKDMVMMRVIGDSMHPTIQANDTVMVDTGRKAIREGEIYAIRFDQTIMIKRLSFRPGGKIQIISDNLAYQAYEADIQDIHIIGQVIFFSRVLIQE